MSPRTRSLSGIAGIDEAGRGPMFGPMIVCGVLFDSSSIKKLRSLGVRDSKTLSVKKRETLAKMVHEMSSRVAIERIDALQIDKLREQGVTLNDIEATAFSTVLRELSPAEVYADAADVNPKRFGERIGLESGLILRNCKIVSEHKADSKYPVVSAASIIAKTTRDEIIRELHGEYGDFGSGYPSDPRSVLFLRNLIRKNEKMPDFVRKTWKSVTQAISDSQKIQTKLEDY
ncbi:MAG: ribonuclease HII [Candidatus Thorarchaeota archaeon]